MANVWNSFLLFSSIQVWKRKKIKTKGGLWIEKNFFLYWIGKKPKSFLVRALKAESIQSNQHPVLHHNGNGNRQLPLLLSHFSRVLLCATPQTAAHQAPQSLGFFKQEHWSGLPFPSPVTGSSQHLKTLSVCFMWTTSFNPQNNPALYHLFTHNKWQSSSWMPYMLDYSMHSLPC